MRKRTVQVLGAIVVLLVLALGWLAYAAFQVKGELESARDQAQSARALILRGDQDGAQRAAQAAADHAQSASERAHGVVWSAAAAIPWLGSPLDSVQQMTDAVAELSSEVMVPSAKLASALNPNEIRSGDAINTAPLRAAQPELATLAKRSDAIVKQVDAINPSWLGTVADAHTQLQEQVEQAAATLNGTNIAAQLVPSMLGADGPRNYFLALQTPSESRGTGGLVGGYAIIDATDGRITAPALGANSDLRSPTRPLVDLGAEYDAIYDSYHPYTDFRNSNLSANFPDAAQIWLANWKAQTGQQLDGAIALDPVALSYVLAVTGPVTLPDGEKITAENVVPITLSTSYVRFADDNAARKAYLQSISRAAVTQLGRFSGDTGALLEALGRGVHERRIMVYSTDPAEQETLQTTNLGHQVSDTTAPYLQVAIGNAAGNKLDYYLRRDITYTAGACTGDSRESTVTVRLTNTLEDTSLPDYVAGSMGAQLSFPKGTNVANVEMLLTRGATVKQITVDDQDPLFVQSTLHGRPFVSTLVPIQPGQTVTVQLTLDEPTSAIGPAQVPIQPLVDEPQVNVDVPTCPG